MALQLPAATAVAAVPDRLRPPEGQQLVLQASASGVQIYECRTDAAGVSTWAFKEPAAQLRQNIIHYRGPNWQSTQDGSRVMGRVVASVPNINPAKNIPDLLLEAVGNSGDGVLGSIDFVQRLRSMGGVGPTGSCNPSADDEVAVQYTSAYRFWSDAR
ncbi:MAG: DUF3455 domain-containing protein [Pseudonocardiaceae bacterium]